MMDFSLSIQAQDYGHWSSTHLVGTLLAQINSTLELLEGHVCKQETESIGILA